MGKKLETPAQKGDVEGSDSLNRLQSGSWNPDADMHNRGTNRIPGRGRIIGEVKVRAPQPIHGIARATRLTFAFPSKEFRIRRKIEEALKDEEGDSILTKIKSLKSETTLQDIIQSVSPAHFDQLNLQGNSYSKFIGAIREFETSIRSVWSHSEINRKVVRQIAELIDRMQLEIDSDIGIFDPVKSGKVVKENNELCIRYPEGFDYGKGEEPTPRYSDKSKPWNKLSASKLWFTFCRGQKHDSKKLSYGQPTEVKQDARLRMFWEKFHLTQNFTAIEDFYTSSRDGEPLSKKELESYDNVLNYFLKKEVGDPDFRQWDDDKLTAIHALEEHLDELFPDLVDKKWFGSLLVAAHYWVIPCELFLNRLKDWKSAKSRKFIRCLISQAERERQEITRSIKSGQKVVNLSDYKSLIEVAGLWASQIFGQGDYESIKIGKLDFTESPEVWAESFRRDFALSGVCGGRAIVVSDLRPGPTPIGRGSRTMIIDLGLNIEQRGRLLGRLMDLATFRILALKELPFVNSVEFAVNQIGTELSNYYTKLNDIDWAQRFDGTSIDKEIEPIRASINRLTVALSALNMFLTNGITGTALSSEDYINQVLSRTKGLREQQIEGFQTIREFLVRVEASVQVITRLERRYESIRRRLGQIGAALQANITLSQSAEAHDTLEKQSRILDQQTVLLKNQMNNMEAQSHIMTKQAKAMEEQLDATKKVKLYTIILLVVALSSFVDLIHEGALYFWNEFASKPKDTAELAPLNNTDFDTSKPEIGPDPGTDKSQDHKSI